MSALADYLFPTPARRTATEIVKWWERRRLAYNVFVGGAGVITLVVVSVVKLLPPLSEPGLLPLAPVVVYGVMANVMFTLGWIVELAAERLFQGDLLPIGPALHRMGLTFALGLTLLPALLVTGVWFIATVVTLLGLG